MRGLGLAMAMLLCLSLACDSLPGKPREEERFVEPSKVTDFAALYAHNCSGCHGAQGKRGPARALNDPLYLAVAPLEAIESAIRDGIEGTPMPAFAFSEGGTLTDEQVKAVAMGLSRQWGAAVRRELPSYHASGPGNAVRGEEVFGVFCADCHGANGRGGEKAGSVVDPSLLALTSDQGLRTTVIVGREDLEMPNYSAYVEGRAMREDEISDVVAWLISQRVEYPGQPYPDASAAQPPEGGP